MDKDDMDMLEIERAAHAQEFNDLKTKLEAALKQVRELKELLA